jgi:hypothetical protein
MILNAMRYRSNPDRSTVALGSIDPHEAWVKLVIPHQEITPPTETPIPGDPEWIQKNIQKI